MTVKSLKFIKIEVIKKERKRRKGYNGLGFKS